MTPSEKSKRLGRGLSALLGEPDVEAATAKTNDSPEPVKPDSAVGQTVRSLPIEWIRPNPEQPRKTIGEDELSALTESIAEKGVVQPILVRPVGRSGESYEIVAGERRWRAAQRARLHEIPVLVRELTDRETLEIGIVENVQRADLNPIEEAYAYQQLIEKFGHTQSDVANVVSKSRSHIANMVRLLNLPDPVRKLVAQGDLSAGHARAIATAPNCAELATKIVEEGLSVREAEKLARAADGTKPKTASNRAPETKDADTRALESDLTNRLGLTVDIRHGKSGGEIRVSYSTLEQLDDVCRRLGSN